MCKHALSVVRCALVDPNVCIRLTYAPWFRCVFEKKFSHPLQFNGWLIERLTRCVPMHSLTHSIRFIFIDPSFQINCFVYLYFYCCCCCCVCAILFSARTERSGESCASLLDFCKSHTKCKFFFLLLLLLSVYIFTSSACDKTKTVPIFVNWFQWLVQLLCHHWLSMLRMMYLLCDSHLKLTKNTIHCWLSIEFSLFSVCWKPICTQFNPFFTWSISCQHRYKNCSIIEKTINETMLHKCIP